MGFRVEDFGAFEFLGIWVWDFGALGFGGLGFRILGLEVWGSRV